LVRVLINLRRDQWRKAPVPLRRVALSAAVTAVAALIIVGLLFGNGNRGTLQAAVRFEVRLAETQPVPGLIVARVADSRRVIYLHPEMIVTNDDIAQAAVVQDGLDRFGVSVELLQSGAQRMQQATANHIGRPVAVLIDSEVVTAPVVRSAISNSAWITGNYTQAAAERIANGISLR
jgi:SecD-like export protein